MLHLYLMLYVSHKLSVKKKKKEKERKKTDFSDFCLKIELKIRIFSTILYRWKDRTVLF